MAGTCSVFIASKAERSGPLLGAASFGRRRMGSRTSTTTRGTCNLWWGGFDVCPKLEDLHPPLPVSVLKVHAQTSTYLVTFSDTLSGTNLIRSARRCPTEICHRATQIPSYPVRRVCEGGRLFSLPLRETPLAKEQLSP